MTFDTERAKRIQLLIVDVDGVLTDGRIVYDEYGDELKFFDVQDGSGLVFWARAGLKSAIITARKSKLVARRAKEMQVTELFQKALEKIKPYEKLLKRWKLTDEQVCVIADDLFELPLMRRAGLPVCVPNAVAEVKAAAHYQTQRPGGRGAVRELVELILQAQGKWEGMLKRYTS